MSETLATRESALTLLERHEEKDDVRNEHDAGFISGLGQRNTFDCAAIQFFWLQTLASAWQSKAWHFFGRGNQETFLVIKSQLGIMF